MKKYQNTLIKYGFAIAVAATLTVVYATKDSTSLGARDLTYTTVVWDKPSTEAEWAEDIKQENIDIRPDDVLDAMLDMHISKLEREVVTTQKYRDMLTAGQDPIEYLYWKWRENLTQYGYPPEEIEAEAMRQAQEQYDREVRSVEKLTQSIERMAKERELRRSGYLIVVDGKSQPEGEMLGSAIDDSRIRYVQY